MAGAFAPVADTRVALKAVASIDHLIRVSTHDLFLKEVLASANRVLRSNSDLAGTATPDCISESSILLH